MRERMRRREKWFRMEDEREARITLEERERRRIAASLGFDEQPFFLDPHHVNLTDEPRAPAPT